MLDRKLLTLIILLVMITIPFFIFRYQDLSGTVPKYLGYNDINTLYEKPQEPGLPYINKVIEYPVITGLFIQTMSWLGQTKEFYFILNHALLLLFGIITTYILYRILPLKDRNRLVLFWVLAPSMIVFLVYNWDIIPVMLTVLSIYFFQNKKEGLSSMSLALGFSAKFFPVLFLIPLLIKGKNKVRILGVFILSFLVVNGYFMLLNFQGWWGTYPYHIERTANYDSVFGLLNYAVPNLDPAIVTIFSLGGFLLVYFLVLWKRADRSFLELCFLSILVFLIFNKVFSPQYLLWLLPFFVLLGVRKKFFYGLGFSNLLVFFLVMAWYFTGIGITLFWAISLFVIIRHSFIVLLLYGLIRKRVT